MDCRRRDQTAPAHPERPEAARLQLAVERGSPDAEHVGSFLNTEQAIRRAPSTSGLSPYLVTDGGRKLG